MALFLYVYTGAMHILDVEKFSFCWMKGFMPLLICLTAATGFAGQETLYNMRLINSVIQQAASPTQQGPSLQSYEEQAACHIHNQMASYVQQPRIQKLIRTGYANPRGTPYFCYRHIKKILDLAGLVTDSTDVGDTREEQTYARMADVALADHGFVNILKCPAARNMTPDDAPVGSLLVYEPKVPFDRRRVKNADNLNAGDIQLKLSSNSYLNYMMANKSFLENNNGNNSTLYRLKAILLLQ